MDTAIVGGGLIGLAVAWRAAQRGLAVVVIDAATHGAASGVAAGMLAPVAEAQFGEGELLQLNLESWRRYASFVRELEEEAGAATGYVECGSLLVARDADDNAVLERDYRFRVRMGLQVERLTGAECRALEPRLAPSIRGGVLAAGDHQVDPRRLVAALTSACLRRGVRLLSAEAGVSMSDGRVSGVVANGESISAANVVLAAGCWSHRITGVPRDVLPPVRPVKGQVLRLVQSDRAPVARHVIRGVEGYALARPDGELVAGATMEERGFDTTVTAGGVHEILRAARELIPDVVEMELVEASAGLRPGTPDNAPVIGHTAVQGLLAATGHHRNGVLLTPVTADSVAALLAEEQPPVDISHFGADRFTAPAGVTA